ncbi:MAG: hypothetical protein GY797_16810 [Deltaproteobacteria bacterium]|nr:hypothetical protein [Deltaproteobacteria bacterium]
MALEIIRYYNSEEDFNQFHNNLKQLPCPRCKLTGALILNGRLRGNSENSFNIKVVRGRRIFCSNRRKRSKGCGITFCVFLAGILKNFSITAKSLWSFLKNIVSSSNRIEAFRSMEFPQSTSSCYRLWKRFSTSQSRIRSFLVKLSPSPELSKTCHPEIQTIAHLESVFSNYSLAISPIAAFQTHFQAPFL